MDSHRILLAEDDPLMARLIEYKLTKAGYTVDSALDGEAAVTALSQQRYDLLLLDLMMPRVDGFQVLQRIYEGEVHAPRATIIVSARNSDDDILHAFNLGAVDFVTKPLSMDVLVARVGIALRTKVIVGTTGAASAHNVTSGGTAG